MSPPGRSEQASRVRGVVRWVITSIIFLILIAASLFLSAGTQDWRMAWGYLGLAAVIQLLDALVLIPLSPDLLVERSRYQKGAKKWDQVLSRLMAIIGPITIWILSGIDYRYSWSPETPMWLLIISAGIVFSGGLLSLWAMASNKFFIGMVRIQKERGHSVITSGPYHYIRHPGYLGGLLYIFFTPIILGSVWALIPAVLTCGVVVLRTYLEDNTLKDELAGYLEYSQVVRSRLLPGIW